jgi:tRNA A-37 threonylcarbamoyl transferase component Bud32
MTVPQLPGFRYVKPLGRGGYGEVYSAYQDQFDRWVAVKVLTFKLADERLQRQFVRECRLAGRLSAHPNIVTVYDSGIVAGGRPYITMELFPDGSIADALQLRGQLPVADALRIGVALAGALETAHQAGVVHRDVKPANVLLAAYGQPALTDFGLSVVAEQHEVSMGVDALTPYHAAPEVLERTAATAVSDVYSLASTIYAMLAGRAPHQGSDESSDSIASLLLRVLQRDVPLLPRPDAPPSLRATLDAALVRDPALRTPTARALATELQAVQRELGLEVTEPVVMAVPGAVEAPALPERRAGIVLPPPPPAPPLPPAAPAAAPAAPAAPERPALPTRASNRPAAPSAPVADRAPLDEPSLDQLAALERAVAARPSSAEPPAPAGPARRPPPAPLRRRPDVPAPARPATTPAAAAPPAAAPRVPVPPPAPAPPEAVPPAPVAPPPVPSPPAPPAPAAPPAPPSPPGWPMETSRTPAADGPETPPAPPTPPAAPTPRRDEPEVPLPAWVTDAVGAALPPATPAPEPRPTGFSDEPDGDTTIERAVVRGYLPPARPAPHPGGPPAPPPVEPRRRSRALPVLAAVVGVAALAAAAFVLIPRDDGGPGPGPDQPATTSTSLVVPTGLAAVESAAGVQLDWEGPEADGYAVLMLSEIAAPRVLPVDAGTSMLVPTTSLVPDDAYCFAVAYVAGLEAAPRSEDAFSPPACIRGASEDTVRPD